MSKTNESFAFRVLPEGKPEKPLSYSAYLYSKNGKLLTRAAVKDHQFSLDANEATIRNGRIFIVPDAEKGTVKTDNLAFAEKFGYHVILPGESLGKLTQLHPIPERIWCRWYFCICRIRGRVFNTHCGTNVPVANARVHVCEVDPIIWLLKNIPDPDIRRLKDELEKLRRIPDLKDPHIHFPPIGPDPSPIEHVHIIGPENPMMEMRSKVPDTNTQLLLKAQPQENIALYHSNSPVLIREYLIQNVMWLRPLFCYLPFWWWYRCDEIRVIDTDANGYFDFYYWYNCTDKPDLYFWVEYFVNGTWVTVYHPWLPCSVRWDYHCGDLINIYINDDRLPCHDYPTSSGRDVHVLSIGRNANVHNINQTTGLWNNTTPFGGSLDPRVIFGDDLINGANPVHSYKWSVRLFGPSNPGAPWSDITATVKRFYLDPADHTKTKELILGPNTAQNLYDVVGTFAPGTSEPFIVPVGQDRAALGTAFLDTIGRHLGYDTSVATNNIYELKFELFNAAGNVIDLKAAGIKLYIPTSLDPMTFTEVNESQNTDYLILETVGAVKKYMGFRMIVRVDNNPVSAYIHETTVGAVSAGPCGMIEYHNLSDMATISFTATHAYNFADYGFSLVRGSSGSIMSLSGNVNNAPGVPGSTNPYTQTMAVDALLGPCVDAAFSENLSARSTANDGYDRVYGYVGDVKAFALKKV